MKIPILKLRNILLTSIQVELTDQDALKFQEDVLTNAVETGAQGFIIDITALEVVDSYLARIINDTASMLKMVGAEAVVCGMQPSVALTLVEMGRGLIGVETALNLDQGMEKMAEIISGRAKYGA